jgi:hypothetical protein
VAYIYMSSGAVLKVQEGRDGVLLKLREAGVDTVDFEIDFPAGGATLLRPVTVTRGQVAVVSDEQLPKV